MKSIIKQIGKTFLCLIIIYISILIIAFLSGILVQPIIWSYVAGEKVVDRIEKFYYVNILGWQDAEQDKYYNE